MQPVLAGEASRANQARNHLRRCVVVSIAQGPNSARAIVMVHGVVVASSQANTAAGAARRASAQAVAILEREPARFAQVCDCRSRVNTQKAQRKALRAMLRGFVENDAELEKMLPTGR
jgi:hypothetical protein